MECNWDHFFTKTFVAILAYVTTIEKTLIHKKLAFLLQIFGPNPRAIGKSYIQNSFHKLMKQSMKKIGSLFICLTYRQKYKGQCKICSSQND